MQRKRVGELMDDPAIDPGEHEHALRGLNKINRLLGVDRRLWRELQTCGEVAAQTVAHEGRRYLARSNGAVLDIGCGAGGFLGFVAARATGKESRLIGIDRSAFALHCARHWQSPDIMWMSGDAQRLPLADNSVGVVTCSLFLHHFDEPEVIEVLREAGRVTSDAVIVADLVRSWPAWALTWIATRVVSRSRIFHVDGPRSVLAAYRPVELIALSRRAGLAGARVQRTFPFRMILVWRKASAA
jgi:2-polyprenyl-3-methyl-5-hydroxy-6-metoxy-1,4-benzoquinol methylase